MALERGRNHSGSGLMVFERDRVGGNGTDIIARRLQCTNSFDCDDGDVTTPDRCVAAGARFVCDRTPIIPDGGYSPDASLEAGVDVPHMLTSRDVPNGLDASNGTDVLSAQEGSVMDVPSALFADGADGADGAAGMDGSSVADDSVSRFEDGTSASLDGRAASQDSSVSSNPLAFGGGACACRTTAGTRTTPLKWLSFAALAALAARRKQRRRIQRS